MFRISSCSVAAIIIAVIASTWTIAMRSQTRIRVMIRVTIIIQVTINKKKIIQPLKNKFLNWER